MMEWKKSNICMLLVSHEYMFIIVYNTIQYATYTTYYFKIDCLELFYVINISYKNSTFLDRNIVFCIYKSLVTCYSLHFFTTLL